MYNYDKWNVNNIPLNDRATIAAVLKERLLKLRHCEHAVNIEHDCDNCNANEHPYGADIKFNQALDQAIAIIDEVLTSEANK